MDCAPLRSVLRLRSGGGRSYLGTGSVNLGTGKAKCSPLILAAAAGKNAVVQTLIINGAEVNAVAWAGTPLQAASRELNEDGVMLLLANGAKPNVASSGLSTLAYAAQGRDEAIREQPDAPILQKYDEIVAALIAFGANPAQPATDGGALKAQIIAEYRGTNWKPPKDPSQSEPTPAPSDRPHVGRIRSDSALTPTPATQPAP